MCTRNYLDLFPSQGIRKRNSIKSNMRSFRFSVTTMALCDTGMKNVGLVNMTVARWSGVILSWLMKEEEEAEAEGWAVATQAVVSLLGEAEVERDLVPPIIQVMVMALAGVPHHRREMISWKKNYHQGKDSTLIL